MRLKEGLSADDFAAVARRTQDLVGRAAKPAEQMEDSQIGRYLAARGLLDSRNVHHFGVVGEPVQGHERYEGRLAIPSSGRRKRLRYPVPMHTGPTIERVNAPSI